MSAVDLLYLAWNRLEFTRETFTTLLRNTDWRLVRELVVWDDGSEDGTVEWLRDAVAAAPVPVRFVQTRLRSPVAVMGRFIEQAQAPLVAKVDNDTMLPPGWLAEAVAVLEAHPELTLLGLEAHHPLRDGTGSPRTYVPATFVSGLGIYRRAAFARRRPAPIGQWFGFEEWQRRQGGLVRAGWLSPALPIFLLDRVPLEPWRTLTAEYVARGWQRPWPPYEASCPLWRWCWPETHGAPRPPREAREGDFDVVILSARAENLVPCVRAVLAQEPTLEPSRIIVVDDGARAGAEAQLPGVRWVEGARPFIFARNANLGIAASGRDVVLLNDDALLTTPGGFHSLSRAARGDPGLGLVSSGIRGVVGNANQLARAGAGIRSEGRTLCFVCIYLPRQVYERVGPLDERFAGYGFEDDDYSERVRKEGLRLAIDDGCVVDHSGRLPSTFRTRSDHASLFAQNRRLFEEKRGPAQAPRFLGVMRVKNESAHIGEALESMLPLCERVLVLDDHSEDDTATICRSFGERVEVLESPFQGLDESRDKNFLLRELARFRPDWVLWIDGDEVLERSGPERLRAAVSRAGSASAFTLRIAYVWDEPSRVRIDGIFGQFRRASLFRHAGQPVSRLFFPVTAGPNFHCGNVPRGLAGPVRHTEVRLKHYGYMEAERRLHKYEWYNRVDPDNEKEDRYRHLASIPGARFAPGPPVIVPWRD